MPDLNNIENTKIAVIGLGYVGLPLAVEFGKHFETVGFDINAARIAELNAGHDSTLEITDEELAGAHRFSCAESLDDIRDCDVYIVTVPTPIDGAKRPDLGALRGASHTVGGVLSAGNTVIYESTVYPGATEYDCAPILEDVSGLTLNEDFLKRRTVLLITHRPMSLESADRVLRMEGGALTRILHQGVNRLGRNYLNG